MAFAGSASSASASSASAPKLGAAKPVGVGATGTLTSGGTGVVVGGNGVVPGGTASVPGGRGVVPGGIASVPGGGGASGVAVAEKYRFSASRSTRGSRSSGAAHANTTPPHRPANTNSTAPKRFILVTFLPNAERVCRVHVEGRALGKWRIGAGLSAIASQLQPTGDGVASVGSRPNAPNARVSGVNGAP